MGMKGQTREKMARGEREGGREGGKGRKEGDGKKEGVRGRVV